MPIAYTRAYVANGKTFANLAEAQAAEIETICHDKERGLVNLEEVPEFIVAHAAEIIGILSLKDSSRPAARKSRKSRKSVTEGISANQTPRLFDPNQTNERNQNVSTTVS